MATNDSTHSPDSVHNPITSAGQSANLRIERDDDIIHIKDALSSRELFTAQLIPHDIEPRIYFTDLPYWKGPILLEDAKWLHAALTEALAQAAALTPPPEEYERLENVVLHGFTHAPRIRYANLTDSLQEAALRLMARGELVRDGDYIMPAPAAPDQWWGIGDIVEHVEQDWGIGKVKTVGNLSEKDGSRWIWVEMDNGAVYKDTADYWRHVAPAAAPAPTGKLTAAQRKAHTANQALTRIQRTALENIVKHDGIRVSMYNGDYAIHSGTARKLMKLGLIEWADANRDYVVLTPAGRAALGGEAK